jgi:hypothetical protein
MTRLTKFGNSLGVGLSFLYSVSIGEPLKGSGVGLGNASSASFDQAVVAETAEILTTLRTFFRMTDGDLHRAAAAHAVTEHIGLLNTLETGARLRRAMMIDSARRGSSAV